jgi:hypothetical protein
MGEEKSANTAGSYGVDSNWYANSGTTDHITGKLDKLAVMDTYNGNDQVYTASASGIHIQHNGQAVIHTPYHDLTLIHVPKASKNLAFIHHITSDNNIFFELHPNFSYQGLGVEENTPPR